MIDAYVDMSSHILISLVVAFSLALVSNLSLVFAYRAISKSLLERVSPISHLTYNFLDASRRLPDSLQAKLETIPDDKVSTEIKNLLESRAILFSKLSEYYEQQAEFQFNKARAASAWSLRSLPTFIRFMNLSHASALPISPGSFQISLITRSTPSRVLVA